MTVLVTPTPQSPHDDAPQRRSPSDGRDESIVMPGSALVLPAISPAEVESLNAFYRRRPALAFPLAGHTATITASWPMASDNVSDRYRLDITVDGTPGALILSRSLIKTVMAGLDPDQELDHLDPRHLALLLELALANPLAALEASLSSQLAINAVWTAGDEGSGATSLAFRIAVDGLGSFCGELQLHPRYATIFAQFLDRCAAGFAAAIELPVPVCVRIAATTCSVGELATLSPGDVVTADHSCRRTRTAVAVLAEHLVAPAELTAAGAHLTAPPERVYGSLWEWSMENGGHGSRADVLEKTDLEDIPVKLLFELGRVELSLAEVRQLGPGALIALPRPLEDSVDISANGRRIGRGNLVRIGDNLGVRITRLFHNV